MKNQDKVIIRSLQKRDRKDIIKNYYDRYEEVKANKNLGILFNEEKPSLKEEYKWFKNLLNEIKKGKAFTSVAEVGNMTVGLCDVRFGQSLETGHIGHLGIYIRKEYRAMGIGTKLIAYVLQMLKQKQKRKPIIIVLAVFANNKHAQRLYKKFGFKKYGILPRGIIRYRKKIDEIYMYKELRK